MPADSDAVAKLQAVGYTHRLDLQPLVPFRRFLQRKGSPLGPDVNLHIVERQHPWWDRHLILRAYLRSNESARRRYEELKLDLAAREDMNIDTYCHAKSPLLLQLEEEAFGHFDLDDSARQRLRSGRV